MSYGFLCVWVCVCGLHSFQGKSVKISPNKINNMIHWNTKRHSPDESNTLEN